MPALNFKKQFAPKVESGEKDQSIRPRGKRIYRVGDTLKLYTGQRTKYCRLLGTATISEVFNIDIIQPSFDRDATVRVYVKRKLKPSKMREIVERDGFRSIPDFFQFFYEQYGERFYGQVIRWTNFKPATKGN